MRLVYFAQVREAIGFDSEELVLPIEIQTVGNCVEWLAGRGINYATALSDPSRLRFALDQQMVWNGTAIEGAEELAIFPPVTGG